MVLYELGRKIKDVLNKLNQSDEITQQVFNDMLNSISLALIKSDVNLKMVKELQNKIRNQFKEIEGQFGNKKLMIQRSVVKSLQEMLTSKKSQYKIIKGKSNVVMFVGLQGSGKTTTCTKYAYFYKKKGWKVGLVCADTFRAGAFDQLKQNATKCKIPFYGSYTEMDPVKIAEEGVSKFKKEKYELIIVDTSGRHKQEESLFEEMKQIESAIKPDNIIFVMDSHIGQACYAQADFFNKTVKIGSVIITKLDGHAKGGGALSAVAATQSPIIFIGTGENFDDFEIFNPETFINRLLGFGDIKGLCDKIKDICKPKDEKDFEIMFKKGKFTLNNMREQYNYLMKMGPLDKVIHMIPGMSDMMTKGGEKEASKKIKKYLCIMDSMTEAELNCKVKIDENRAKRIARGSGSNYSDVLLILEEYKKMSKIIEKMGSFSKLKGFDISNIKNNPFSDKFHERNQIAGTAEITNLMKDFENIKKFKNLGGLKRKIKK